MRTEAGPDLTTCAVTHPEPKPAPTCRDPQA